MKVYSNRTIGISGTLLLLFAPVMLAAIASAALQALPQPRSQGGQSLEESIAARRSVRRYADAPLTQDEIGQLCWSAQGITDTRRGFRAAPSAGATFPLELYVATEDGVFRYLPEQHALERHLEDDIRRGLRRAGLGQSMLEEAPAVFIFAADVRRTARRYGERAERYVWMEVGHASQNLLLQVVALDLAAVPIGAFRDDDLARVLRLPDGQQPFYLVPVGRPSANPNANM